MKEKLKEKYNVHAIDDCDENEGGYFCMIYYIYKGVEDEDFFDYFCIHHEELEEYTKRGLSLNEAQEQLINEYMQGYNYIPDWHK